MQVAAIVEDIIILPLVLLALALKILFKVTLSILIRILDYAFPVLLQVMRFLCSRPVLWATGLRRL